LSEGVSALHEPEDEQHGQAEHGQHLGHSQAEGNLARRGEADDREHEIDGEVGEEEQEERPSLAPARLLSAALEALEGHCK
jgi:hypothetical protein